MIAAPRTLATVDTFANSALHSINHRSHFGSRYLIVACYTQSRFCWSVIPTAHATSPESFFSLFWDTCVLVLCPAARGPEHPCRFSAKSSKQSSRIYDRELHLLENVYFVKHPTQERSCESGDEPSRELINWLKTSMASLVVGCSGGGRPK